MKDEALGGRGRGRGAGERGRVRSPRMAGHNCTGPSSGYVTPIGQFHALIIRSMSGLKQIERTLICVSRDAECYNICVALFRSLGFVKFRCSFAATKINVTKCHCRQGSSLIHSPELWGSNFSPRILQFRPRFLDFSGKLQVYQPT